MVLPNTFMGSARVKCANRESNPTIILLITRSARQTARSGNSNSLFDSLVPFLLQLYPDLLQVDFKEVGWRQLFNMVATGPTRVYSRTHGRKNFCLRFVPISPISFLLYVVDNENLYLINNLIREIYFVIYVFDVAEEKGNIENMP